MKKILLIIFICCFGCRADNQTEFGDLLDAIEWVESRGDANAVGDGGEAIGAYQLHRSYIDDCNRIMKLYEKRLGRAVPIIIDGEEYYSFSYNDRWDKVKSRIITAIVILYYGKGDIETMARTHKCPPKRYDDFTLPYWKLIKAQLKETEK